MRLTNIVYMKVLEASIPFTYYTVNTDNNAATLVDTGGTFFFTLTPGTYSVASMITELTARLNASGTGFTYVVTHNANTLAFTISNGSAVAANTFSITFSTPGIRKDTLGNVLGFGVGARPSAFNGATNVLIGTVAELTGSNFLYINSNTVGNETNLFLPRGSTQFGNGGPQMAMMSANGDFGQDHLYTDPCPELWFDMAGIESLTKIDLFISDGGTQQITRFNGQGFSVKLGILLTDRSVERGNYGHITSDRLVVGGKRGRIQ